MSFTQNVENIIHSGSTDMSDGGLFIGMMPGGTSEGPSYSSVKELVASNAPIETADVYNPQFALCSDICGAMEHHLLGSYGDERRPIELESCNDEPSYTTSEVERPSDSASFYFYRTRSTKAGRNANLSNPAFDSAPRRQQIINKTTHATTSCRVEPVEEDKVDRHERILERNRIAASKCRTRKRSWVKKLEEKRAALEAQHMELQSQYHELLQDLTQVKSHLICHSGCQDENINAWVDKEASEYVRGLSDNRPQIQAGTDSPFSSLDGSILL